MLREFALDTVGTVSIEETSSKNLLKLSTRTYWQRVWPAGLGLAAVHRIVDLHGGWIKVESHQHRGTCFVVCLPRSGEHVKLWHEGRTPWKRS